MSSKKKQPQIKPVEDWSVEEWEKAYNVLSRKHELVREQMRKALKLLSAAV